MPWQLRVHETILPDVEAYVTTKFDVYVIGGRETGKRETPHHHIWIKDDVSESTLKKTCQRFCIAKGYKTERGKANAYYSLKPWDDNFSYMCKHSVRVWKGVPDDHPHLKPALPSLLVSDVEGTAGVGTALSGPQTASPPVVYHIQKPRRVGESMRAKFVRYLQTELHWERGCITRETRESSKRKMISELVDFWENAFTTPQGAVCIEHAVWYFADELVLADLRMATYHRLNEILRC